MKILVVMETKERHREWLQKNAADAELHFIRSKNVTESDVADADAVIGNLPCRLLPAAKKLRWLQLNSAGADAYCQDSILREDVLLTNATGAYGLALSEHLLAQLLAMMKKLYPYYDNQKKGLWHDEGEVTSIEDSRVLILGIGDIGRAFARRVKALGAHVTAVKAQSPSASTRSARWTTSTNCWEPRTSSFPHCPPPPRRQAFSTRPASPP